MNDDLSRPGVVFLVVVAFAAVGLIAVAVVIGLTLFGGPQAPFIYELN